MSKHKNQNKCIFEFWSKEKKMMVNCGVEAVAYYGTRPLCKEHADLQDKDRLIFIKKTETKSS